MPSKPLYPAYLPTRPDGPSVPIAVPFFEADEPARRANPAKPSLLKAGVTAINVTPRIGTEIRGVQISELSKEGLDELALLAAERGVVVFVRPDFLFRFSFFASLFFST
jgi:sulfonate dioxygenase